MQTTSATYNTLLANADSYFENKLVIDTVGTFNEDTIISIEIENAVMNKTLEIGNAVSAEITVKMLTPVSAIPRMAKLTPYIRVCSGSSSSEWIKQGEYFIDTRSHSVSPSGDSVLTLHGYDAMLKAEQEYPDTNHSWPYKDTLVVAEKHSICGDLRF